MFSLSTNTNKNHRTLTLRKNINKWGKLKVEKVIFPEKIHHIRDNIYNFKQTKISISLAFPLIQRSTGQQQFRRCDKNYHQKPVIKGRIGLGLQFYRVVQNIEEGVITGTGAGSWELTNRNRKHKAEVTTWKSEVMSKSRGSLCQLKGWLLSLIVATLGTKYSKTWDHGEYLFKPSKSNTEN